MGVDKDSKSGRADSKSGKPVAKSGKADSKSDKADAKSGKPDKADAKPDTKSDKADKADAKRDAKSDKPDGKSDKRDGKSDKPDAKSDKPDAKSDKADAKSDKPDKADAKPDTKSARPDKAANGDDGPGWSFAEILPPNKLPSGAPTETAEPPGPAPRGDSRSFRRRGSSGEEFCLIYRVNRNLIERVGEVGKLGTFEVTEYPSQGAAAHAYAQRCSELTEAGYRDLPRP